MKRLMDMTFSLFGLLLSSPILLPTLFLVWLQDRHSPFYLASRVGVNGKTFRIVKARSMVINADRSGVDSTAGDDSRITVVGHFIRRFKIDELTQLWNVLRGEMSLVGPRPNVERDVALYTKEEKKLLSVKPGITDLSSIVFSDEGEILKGHPDPDLGYNQLIRPWKSRLGLFYIENQSLWLDLQLTFLTAVAIFAKPLALKGIQKILRRKKVEPLLCQVALREEKLNPYPPPGSVHIVQAR
ncbi:MAG: sugar transferase [Deltaproteobacteria bacterium]|nr:sugar transferase [Deltaproteobacteria bacterium]